MKNTTLCYIENERGDYLMLHRVKKENDCNRDKWIGVGGKFEDGESPEECVLRETLEETGLTLTDWRYRGIVTFVSDRWETEYMHLFTATGWTMDEKNCCHCSQRKKERSPEEYKKLIHRLNRIEGQIRGIRSMVENGAYCPDILIQSAAVNAAVNAFNKELLASHIRTCVAQDIRDGKDEVIDELVATLQKLMK